MDLDWYLVGAWRRYAGLSFALTMLCMPAAREWVAEVALDRGMRIAERRIELLQPVLTDWLTPDTSSAAPS